MKGRGKERRTLTRALPSCRRSSTELADHHISVLSEEAAQQQDFAASRSHLVLEKSCGPTSEGQANLRSLQPEKRAPPDTGSFLEHHQAICSVKHHHTHLLCLRWARGAISAAKRVKGTHVPPCSTPALGDRMGQELGGEPSPTSRSGTHAGASRRCSPPISPNVCCQAEAMAPGCKAATPCPLSPLLVQPLPLPGCSEGRAHFAGREFPPDTPPAPSRSPRSPSLRRLSWQELSRWHGDTPGQLGQQLPFKAQGVTGTAGRDGDPHHRPGSRGAGGRGRRGGGLPSRRHSSCCHRFCLLGRGGRRLGEPGRAPRPGGRGSAAWCRAAERQDPTGPAGGFRPFSGKPRVLRGHLAGTVPSCPGDSRPGA